MAKMHETHFKDNDELKLDILQLKLLLELDKAKNPKSPDYIPPTIEESIALHETKAKELRRVGDYEEAQVHRDIIKLKKVLNEGRQRG